MPLLVDSSPVAVKTRVAIVDDNPQVRLLLRVLLRSSASTIVVAEIEDGDHAAQAVAEAGADVVIMDYEMACVDGIQATREVKAARPAADVVVFSSRCDDEAVLAGFRAAGAVEHFDKADIYELVAFVGSIRGAGALD